MILTTQQEICRMSPDASRHLRRFVSGAALVTFACAPPMTPPPATPSAPAATPPGQTPAAQAPAAQSPAALATAGQPAVTGAPPEAEPRWGMVIHGGAGTISREAMSAEAEAEHRARLAEALRAGHEVLAGGGSALDAVEAAVRLLEDAPQFNAGRGAVFTSDGRNELDASIMDGRTLRAGAIAAVTHVRNPISLARLVMERSVHVMMARDGAEAFGIEHGVEIVDPEWFRTEHRWRQLEQARERERRGADASTSDDTRFGTVGAVALDRAGYIAAATSTGGMTNKRFGRIGDAPIIGAGTYADDSCGVSATGHGEFFIRNVVAYDICARMRYGGASLQNAAQEVVMHRLVAQNAEGGIIAMDRHGNVAMPYNSGGMYRGRIGSDGQPQVFIWRD
jgi:L-asparaginase / beta-aspartyl-peptidase